MREATLSGESFVWLLGSLSQINRIHFDAALFVERFPPPHRRRQVVEAAMHLGFRTGELDSARQPVQQASLPCVGFLKSHPEGGQGSVPAIVISASPERVLYFRACSQRPITIPAAEFSARFEPALLLVRYGRPRPLTAEDGTEPALSFGLRWFRKQLQRHTPKRRLSPKHR